MEHTGLTGVIAKNSDEVIKMKNSTAWLAWGLSVIVLGVGAAQKAAQKRPDLGAYTERDMGIKDIKISVKGENEKDRLISAVLPVYFPFDQESGPQTDPGILTCDVVERLHPLNNGVRDAKGTLEVATEIVLKCGTGPTKRVFVIKGVQFSK